MATAIGLPVVGVITAVSCTRLYRLALRGEVPWCATCAGGVPTGLMLLITPTVVRYYMTAVAAGASACPVLIGVLATCYVAALPDRGSGSDRPSGALPPVAFGPIVMGVTPSQHPEATMFHSVVVGYDGSSHARRALEEAVAIARPDHAISPS